MADDPDYVNPADSPSSPNSKADKKSKRKLGTHASASTASARSDEAGQSLSKRISAALHKWRRALIGLIILIVVLAIGSLIAQMVGNFYIGMGAYIVQLLRVPFFLLFIVIGLGLLVFIIATGASDLLNRGFGLYLMAEIPLLMLVAFLGIAFIVGGLLGAITPIKDIPYLAAPVTGTVYVDGVHESVDKSDDDETTFYYLYCVPEDLPGHDGSRELLSFDIGYENYEAWKYDLGEASPEAANFTSPGLAAVRGKPVYRISMLPNTNTLLSFEEVR